MSNLEELEQKMDELESEIDDIKSNMITRWEIVGLVLGIFIFALWGYMIWKFVKTLFFFVVGFIISLFNHSF